MEVDLISVNLIIFGSLTRKSDFICKAMDGVRPCESIDTPLRWLVASTPQPLLPTRNEGRKVGEYLVLHVANVCPMFFRFLRPPDGPGIKHMAVDST